MVVIGDPTDQALQLAPSLIAPDPGAVDVVIHGLPGRFIDAVTGTMEVPVRVVVELLDAAGIPRGTLLRLITCHGGEAPLVGPAVAELLAQEWGAPTAAANGLLRVFHGSFQIDLVEWNPDPVGGMVPVVTGAGQGMWIGFQP
jgi:hypothetical protein